MLPTPSTSHVDFEKIYEPAEDSFLLLDTLSSAQETQYLRNRFHGSEYQSKAKGTYSTPLLLEIGTGSGVVLAFLSANAPTIFGDERVLTIGTDINAFACAATRRTVSKAVSREFKKDGKTSTGFLAAINADLGSPFRAGLVDVLIFNPPYVPSPDVPSRPQGDLSSFELESQLLALSYAGGADGMEVTNRLLEQLPSLLNPLKGVAYILLCQQNKPEEVMNRVRSWGSEWVVEIVGSSGKQAGWEKLQILRIARDVQV